MKNKNLNKVLFIAASSAMVVPIVADLTVNSVEVNASSTIQLSEKQQGDIIILGGKEYRVILQKYGGTLVQAIDGIRIQFDPDNTSVFDLSDTNNIGYYLNNVYYNSLTSDAKKAIKTVNWHTGSDLNESAQTVSAKIGLLTRSDWASSGIDFGGNIPNLTEDYEFLITPYSDNLDALWYVDHSYGELLAYTQTNENLFVRPAFVLDSNLMIMSDGTVEIADNSNGEIDNTQSDEKVTLKLEQGEFTLQTKKSLDFGQITLAAKKQVATTGFEGNFGIIDARGTQEGWSVTVSATPFTVETFEGFVGTPHQLPVGSLAIKGFDVVQSMNASSTQENIPALVVNDYTIIDNQSSAKLLSANEGQGMGEFEFSFSEDALALTVDALTAKVDTVNYPDQPTPYSSTITWDLVTGP